MRIKSSSVLVLVLALSPAPAAGQESALGIDQIQWTPMFQSTSPVPLNGIRYFRIVRGPIDIMSSTMAIKPGQQLGRLQSVTAVNPRLEEITTVALYWELYEEGDLAAPLTPDVRRLSFSEENIAFESSQPNVSTTILGLR